MAPSGTPYPTFTPAATLRHARRQHQAVALPDGGVAVLGGRFQKKKSLSHQARATVERLVPGKARAVPCADLPSGRSDAAAVALADGSVLVVGGRGERARLADAWWSGPGLDAWRPAGTLSTPREGHRAFALADGSVLVVGGLTGEHMPGGGQMELDRERTWQRRTPLAERWRPGGQAWEVVDEEGPPLHGGVAALLPEGKVLVTGMSTRGGVDAPEAWLLDPDTRRWREAGALLGPRNAYSLTALPDGRVLVAGGMRSHRPHASCELGDPVTGRWEEVGALHMTRVFHTATLLPDGRVLVVGGWGGDTGVQSLPGVEAWDAGTGRWEPVAGLTDGRASHTATLSGDAVWVVGGDGESPPEDGGWRVVLASTERWSLGGGAA